MGNNFSELKDLNNQVYKCVMTELDEPEIKKEDDTNKLKNKIVKRAINPNISYKYENLPTQNQIKEEIINKYKDPDSVLKTTQLVESDIATLGSIIKEEIIKEKNENPDKFLDIEEIIQDEDNENFAVGVLAKSLENAGISTVIEKKSENIDVSNASLQFLTSGLAYKKKLTMTYDFGENENNKILYDKKYQKNFIEKEKTKISKHLGILEKFITICNIRKGSAKYDFIVDDSALIDDDISENSNIDPLTTLNNNFNKLTNKLKKLSTIDTNLKDVSPGMLFEGIKLCPEMFDSRGNNKDGGWAPLGEKRGGKDYFPPYGWIGHGLRVLDKYDEGDNTWIGMNNSNGEWCVAYHGTGIYAVKAILESKFKAGGGQVHQNYDDLNHPGQKVGVGVYCSPKVTEAEGYGDKDNNYKVVFMCRVNPDTVRISSNYPDYWVVDGTSNDIRPYRLLIKKKN